MKNIRILCLSALLVVGIVTPSVVLAVPANTTAVPSFLVLDVRAASGFVLPEWRFTRLPEVSVYSNGTILTPNLITTMQYPGPAVHTIMRRMAPNDVWRIVEGAVRAQLGNTKLNWGTPMIADAPATEVTLRPSRALPQTRITIQALGMDYGLTKKQIAHRTKARMFIDAVSSYARPYVTTKATARPWVSGRWAYMATVDPGDEFSVTRPWFGQELVEDMQCHLMSKSENQQLLAVLPELNQASRWSSGGQTWRVALRPLLPHERSCGDIDR